MVKGLGSAKKFGLGTWLTFSSERLTGRRANRIFDHAFDSGIRHFDTANSYSEGEAERILGRWSRGIPRRDLFLASKLYFPVKSIGLKRGHSKSQILKSVGCSLKNIKTDYLDVLYCHRFDSGTPLVETILTMNKLIQDGVIKSWGTSEWPIDILRLTHQVCAQQGLIPPEYEQAQYSLLRRTHVESELGNLKKTDKFKIVAWSPTLGGVLAKRSTLEKRQVFRTGNHPTPLSQPERIKIRTFFELCDDAALSPAAAAIAWTIYKNRADCCLIGVSSYEQLVENLAALKFQRYTRSLDTIDKLFRPSRRVSQ